MGWADSYSHPQSNDTAHKNSTQPSQDATEPMPGRPS